MKTFLTYTAIAIVAATSLAGCARNLGSDVYTSDSSLSLTLEGKVLSVRPVTIKNSDKLTDNSTGMLAGGALGGVAGASVGKGTGQAAAAVGGAVAGAALGAIAEGALSAQDGLEYVVKVDTKNLKGDYYEGSGAMRNAISTAVTSGLTTVVQGKEQPLAVGQKVYVIFSDKRARVIPAQ